MENASKALLMAAGILIAVILISLLVATYNGISLFQKQQVAQEDVEKIEQFNSFYTKYAGKYVYGTEVITVINQTVNNKDSNDVNVTVKMQENYEYKIGKVTYTANQITVDSGKFMVGSSAGATVIDKKNLTAVDNNLKTRAFQCTEIKYDSKTGKVNSIKFEEKKYST